MLLGPQNIHTTRINGFTSLSKEASALGQLHQFIEMFAKKLDTFSFGDLQFVQERVSDIDKFLSRLCLLKELFDISSYVNPQYASSLTIQLEIVRVESAAKIVKRDLRKLVLKKAAGYDTNNLVMNLQISMRTLAIGLINLQEYLGSIQNSALLIWK